MKKADNIILGHTYTRSTFHNHLIKPIKKVPGDFYLTKEISFSGNKPENKEPKLYHKSIFFELPEIWSDIQVEYLIEILKTKFKWDSYTGKLMYDRFGNNLDVANHPTYPELTKEARTKSVLELLLAIAPGCDYTTALRLNHIFFGLDAKKAPELIEIQNTLDEAEPAFKDRMQSLDDDMKWRKHVSINKLDHFLHHLNDVLTNDKFYGMKLFPEYDTHCFNALGFASKTMNVNSMSIDAIASAHNQVNSIPDEDEPDQAFEATIKYIMNNGLYCDKDSKLSVPDFMNTDDTNPRYLINSMKKSGFGYLMYLTAKELKSIYNDLFAGENKKRIIFNKPVWAFIINSDDDTKFHLLIQ